MSDSMPTSRLFAVIPAAGVSRRMGRPKLLLPLGQQTVIDRLLAVLAPAVHQVAVVTRRHDTPLQAEVARCGGAVIVPAHDPPDMRTSVELGLRWLERQFQPGPQDGWMMLPGDHPVLSSPVIEQLVRIWQAAPQTVVVPTFAGRRGHPLIAPWSLAARVFELPADVGLNVLLRDPAVPLQAVAVSDAGILCDLDDPADYARLQAEFESPRTPALPA